MDSSSANFFSLFFSFFFPGRHQTETNGFTYFLRRRREYDIWRGTQRLLGHDVPVVFEHATVLPPFVVG